MTVRSLLAALVGALVIISGCTSSDSRTEGDASATQADGAGSDEAGDQADDDTFMDEGGGDGVNPDLAEEELGAQTASSGSTLDIMDLRYVSARNGGTVVIRTNGPAQYRIREVPEQKQVVLEIANANLPDRLKRPYITSEFNQTISAINAYQDSGGTTARFVVQMRENERLRIEQRGTEIFLAPETGASGSSIAVSGAETGEDGGGSSGSGGQAIKDGLPANGASLDELNYSSMKFYGKPISIEVRDTSVRDVISFIAEQSGANLVVSDEVKGGISLKLRQVPWDQALLLVMKSRQLGYVRQGNVLRISPLDVLQAETENARKVVEAQRLAQPLRVRVVPVSYGKVAELQTQVKEFLSPRGKIVADSRTSSLVITDIIENIERATNLIKALDIPPLQVQIEAKVVEAREGFTREIGVRWSNDGSGEIGSGDITLTPRFQYNSALQPNLNGFVGGIQVGTLDVLGTLDARLALYEQDEEVKVISAPKVVTMNNELANITQKEQRPFQQTVNNAGTITTSTEFKDVALSLDVTPQITSDSDVIMQVGIKREFLGQPLANSNVPPIFTREAKTRVMVRNGQTSVIGGIYQNDTGTFNFGIPVLKDIPIIGYLFKSKRRVDEKNELLLFLTPRILNAEEGVVKSEEL